VSYICWQYVWELGYVGKYLSQILNSCLSDYSDDALFVLYIIQYIERVNMQKLIVKPRFVWLSQGGTSHWTVHCRRSLLRRYWRAYLRVKERGLL